MSCIELFEKKHIRVHYTNFEAAPVDLLFSLHSNIKYLLMDFNLNFKYGLHPRTTLNFPLFGSATRQHILSLSLSVVGVQTNYPKGA